MESDRWEWQVGRVTCILAQMWQHGVPKAPEFLFWPTEGGEFFSTHLPILKMLGFLWGNQIRVNSTTKFRPPDPISNLALGCWHIHRGGGGGGRCPTLVFSLCQLPSRVHFHGVESGCSIPQAPLIRQQFPAVACGCRWSGLCVRTSISLHHLTRALTPAPQSLRPSFCVSFYSFYSSRALLGREITGIGRMMAARRKVCRRALYRCTHVSMSALQRFMGSANEKLIEQEHRALQLLCLVIRSFIN